MGLPRGVACGEFRGRRATFWPGAEVTQPHGTSSDKDLMRLAKAGDERACAELFDRYRQGLLRTARGRLARQDVAEDVVQETFLAAFKSRHTYDERYGFRTWLWTILINQCRAAQGKLARRPRVAAWSDMPRHEADEPRGFLEDPADAAASPLEGLLRHERGGQLECSLQRINPDQADALRLRFYGGLKFDEIAALQECSLGTAKNRVKWGLLKLSELLRDEAAP